MHDGFFVRRATANDAQAIAAIHAETWRVAYRGMLPDAYLDDLTAEYRLPMWEEILSGRYPDVRVWVAVAGDRVVGFASTNPARDDPGTGELATIYLHPDWMHQGIGRVLLAGAEMGLVEQGLAVARLMVLRDNHRTRRFYERAGWTTAGEERHDEVLGVRVVDLVYRKVLTGTEVDSTQAVTHSRPDSAAWYDQHAGEYAARTDAIDLGDHYDRFLAQVAPGGRVLDAGCGPGRDSAAFIALGYKVTAMDASIGMVELASERLGRRVMHLRHEEVAFDREFDGIWANATLLHVPQDGLPDVLARYRRALVPGGVMFASFKLGSGEVVAGERLFANQDETSFRDVLAAVPAMSLVDVWTSQDRRPGRAHEGWLNVLVRRDDA
ncbi:MAG TPA: bifunctional GNAT family N-acetyltransferase/class I SAM-dependent methyltransferase [Thermomicrobiales bacterium]|nr:bifunctional GNAT family N-acetyltransferase/class I SAM-dependent methyltransferase [Thermomicrobiales bacterium]